MEIIAERRLIRLRPRPFRLLLPALTLLAAAAGAGYLQDRSLEPWQLWLAIGVGALAVLWFLIALLNHLTGWVDVTTSRLIQRAGWFGQYRREYSLAELRGVELALGRSVLIHPSEDSPIELRGIPRRRLVAYEIEKLAKRDAA